ncbi:MAG: hypothetical protein ACOYYU_09735 [Chloroflexota bacterium]
MDEPATASPVTNCREPITLLCGRRMTGEPAYYPQATYRERTIYFCTESCFNAFRADPDAFYLAHSRTAQQEIT